MTRRLLCGAWAGREKPQARPDARHTDALPGRVASLCAFACVRVCVCACLATRDWAAALRVCAPWMRMCLCACFASIRTRSWHCCARRPKSTPDASHEPACCRCITRSERLRQAGITLAPAPRLAPASELAATFAEWPRERADRTHRAEFMACFHRARPLCSVGRSRSSHERFPDASTGKGLITH